MKDDGVGIEAARKLRELGLGEGVAILERQNTDLSLLVLAKEASKLVIVDAVQSGRPPGTVTRFSLDELSSRSLKARISHEPGLYDLISLARQVGISPASVIIAAVEPADCGPGEGLTKAVADAVPRLLDVLLSEVGRSGRQPP